jgi:thioredoxin 1
LSNADLSSNRCSPCKTLALTISSPADKYASRITVCKEDIYRVTAIAEQYGVTAIPTVPVIKKGKEINRLVGLRTKAEYVALLYELVGKAKH